MEADTWKMQNNVTLIFQIARVGEAYLESC